MAKLKTIAPTKNWRIRTPDGVPDGFFFIEADLENPGKHYPRLEVMQEDYGRHNGYDRNTRMADAKLIVAAPDLLKACETLVRHYGFDWRNPAVLLAKAAIKKATLKIPENGES